MSTTIKAKWVNTRKRHYCTGCNRSQPVGSRLMNHVAIFYGDLCNNYYCEPCDEVSKTLDPGDEFGCGDLLEGWQYLEPKPSDWLPRGFI